MFSQIPNFFIVGAPKCGTTSMHYYLSQHPDIFMADKEIQYFASDLIRPWKTLPSAEEKYLSFFSPADNHKIIGDASVWYLYSKEAATRIQAFNPCAKILIMLRNPVDMLYSYYHFFYRLGKEDITDFESALGASEERKQNHKIPKWLYNDDISEYFPVEGLYYCDLVKYSEQVIRYLNLFDNDNIKIIIFDDLIANPHLIYHDVLSFLEVDISFSPKFDKKNPGLQRKIQNETLRNLVRNPVTIWMLKKLSNPSNNQIVSKILGIWDRINNRYEPIPPLNSEIRQKLNVQFSKDVYTLSKLLGRDLSFWLDTY